MHIDGTSPHMDGLRWTLRFTSEEGHSHRKSVPAVLLDAALAIGVTGIACLDQARQRFGYGGAGAKLDSASGRLPYAVLRVRPARALLMRPSGDAFPMFW
jgi:hypothetical protein